MCFYAHPPMGVVVINNTAKLNPFNDKVKFLQCQLLTVVFTFLFFFVVHILWIRNFVYIWVYQNTNTTIMTTFKQPKSLQQTIVSGATRRAQLAKSIAKSLGMDDHNINNRRVIIDQFKNDCAICIIDFDFDNKIAIKIK